MGVPCLTFCYNTLNDRKLANEVHRSARAEEMKVLMARLDRFYAKSKSGGVMGREEMEEGRRMERLFRRWLRSLEDNAVADDEGRSLVVTFEQWPGWIQGDKSGAGLCCVPSSEMVMLRILRQNWAIVAIGIGSMRQALSWRADLEIAEHQQQYFLLSFANSVVFALVLVVADGC